MVNERNNRYVYHIVVQHYHCKLCFTLALVNLSKGKFVLNFFHEIKWQESYQI